MNDFPWDDIRPPREAGQFSVRMIGGDSNPMKRKLFWGKSWKANPALIVEYSPECSITGELPSFLNIGVFDHRETCSLVVELLSLEMRDIFLKVCLDIAASLQDVPDRAIRKASLLRLERWSSFLRPSRSRMSPEAQKGLIAELHFLKRDALAVFNEADAIRGWTGPDSGPRDFAYGQVFVEVKSKRSSANPNIVITSEDQLNVNPSESLFLYVVELNSTPSDDDKGFTISDVVNETRNSIHSPLQIASLESKLANVGYFDEDDYSDTKWSEGSSYYYAVIDGFPKIDSHSCKPGVSRVAYQVDLDYCDDYLVEREMVIDTME